MPTNIATATPGDTCTEFRIKVMIFSPESGFKFDVTIQRKCFPTKWVLNFNLYKKIDGEFVQIVAVEFEAEKKQEQKALEDITTNGVNELQSRAFKKKVYPAVKAGAPAAQIHKEISTAVQLKV